MTFLETVPRPVAHSGREKVAHIKREFTIGKRHYELGPDLACRLGLAAEGAAPIAQKFLDLRGRFPSLQAVAASPQRPHAPAEPATRPRRRARVCIAFQDRG
jgi:hypothetical protein